MVRPHVSSPSLGLTVLRAQVSSGPSVLPKAYTCRAGGGLACFGEHRRGEGVCGGL